MAAIAETRVSLRIFGDALDPDEISRLLGCSASKVAMKGDRRGSGFIERTTRWTLDRDRFAPDDLDKKLRDLLASVSDDPQIWLDLHQRFDVDVFAGLFMTEGNEGVNLEPATMEALSRRGLSLGLDIYAP